VEEEALVHVAMWTLHVEGKANDLAFTLISRVANYTREIYARTNVTSSPP
jgi:hypothetical protein